MLKWEQYVHVKESSWILRGPLVTLPIAPFPGLGVGALVVYQVLVNQGIGINSCEIEYEPVDDVHAEILETQGWTRSDLREATA